MIIFNVVVQIKFVFTLIIVLTCIFTPVVETYSDVKEVVPSVEEIFSCGKQVCRLLIANPSLVEGWGWGWGAGALVTREEGFRF